MVMSGTAGTSARADEGISELGLADCRLTIHFLKESDGQRMYEEGWLPEGHTLGTFLPYGPGSASLSIWVFACEDVDIDGTPAGPAMLSLTGIQVEDRLAHSVYPTHWDNYLVWAHTNNAALERVLRAAELPAFMVPRMQFSWRVEGDRTTANVPWGKSPYELSVAGSISDAPHVHDNTFQHGAGPSVGPRLELLIDPLVPRDQLCQNVDLDIAPKCMSVSTEPGSQMQTFLGTATYTAAADHEPIPHAKIKVVSSDPMSPTTSSPKPRTAARSAPAASGPPSAPVTPPVVGSQPVPSASRLLTSASPRSTNESATIHAASHGNDEGSKVGGFVGAGVIALLVLAISAGSWWARQSARG
jgi:hypothetical protein